ncbi:hypothetical protein OF83DRAFT_1055332 [Amylostereum chailletii]|nr:hypothetical protein OF83DRAFT_1055332 [Amylostereum chailletii]
MTAEQLEHIAVQLRSILARMRAVTSTSLGSIDGGPHRNLPLPGSYLPKHRFGSTRDFLVHFAHGDLVPKNIMVEGSTITAVIDWEHAAFYPSFWEYCRMHDPGFMTPKWGRILEQVFPGPRRQDEIDSVHRVLTDIYWRHDLFG